MPEFDNQQMPKSTWNPDAQNKAQQEAIARQLADRKKAMVEIEQGIHSRYSHVDGHLDIIDIMDHIELVMHTCGAETKANFIEVSETLIKLNTRVPLEGNLYPFLPDSHEDNMRFHKKVTQILVQLPQVYGVKWIPSERGMQLIVTLKAGIK